MKSLFILFFMLLSNALFSQSYQWSTPALMCDSIANNLNPSFMRNWDNMLEYNCMVWERDFGDSSQLLLKDFAIPDSEFILISSLHNSKISHPKISITGLLVWQDNRNNNNDIYSANLDNHRLLNIQQVTSSNLDDITPDLFENLLVWERDSSIYFSEFNYNDSSWSQETVLDSNGCSNPKIGKMQITYQKQNGDSSEVYLIENQGSGWSNPVKISHQGDNKKPYFSFGIFYNLIWQQKVGIDWQIFAVSSYYVQDTITFNFSPFDETNPIGFGVPLITKQSDLIYMFLTFESDSTGDKEIYVNDDIWIISPKNISNYQQEDRRPVFSAGGWQETGYNMVRVWLVWERWSSNQWQLWGCYNDVILASIEDEIFIHPEKYQLFQNYPNPFNSSTKIKYHLPKSGDVKIEIYNLLGQKIKTLAESFNKMGTHEITWNGKDSNNNPVASGIYIYKMITENYSQSQKLLLIK